MWGSLLAEQSEVVKRTTAGGTSGKVTLVSTRNSANLQAGDPIFPVLVQGTLQAVSAELLVRRGEKLFRVKQGQEACSEREQETMERMDGSRSAGPQSSVSHRCCVPKRRVIGDADDEGVAGFATEHDSWTR